MHFHVLVNVTLVNVLVNVQSRLALARGAEDFGISTNELCRDTLNLLLNLFTPKRALCTTVRISRSFYIQKIDPSIPKISIGLVVLKTMSVMPRKSRWQPRKVCEVGPRAPHRGPATRVLTATFAMSMSGQGVRSHLTEASIMISSSSHRSDLSCTRRRTACLLSV